jgi:hypothetical protein
MKRVITLTLAVAWHLAAHADTLPAWLTGTWSTSSTPAHDLDAHNDVHLEADGFGIAVGSTKAVQVPDSAGTTGQTGRVVLGFPVRAAIDGDTLTLTPIVPGEMAARMTLSCRYDAAAPALTCTGPDGVSFHMRRLNDTVDTEVAKMIANFRAQAVQPAPPAGSQR